MSKFLPFVFLISATSLFGIAWIVIQVDPATAPWYIFALFDLSLFVTVWGIFGLILYFVRTKFYKRYDANWYARTSFKMAFFVAFFVAIAAILAILQLVTIFNIILAIVAVALLAIWSYLGKKGSW